MNIEDIVILDHFFNQKECSKYIKLIENEVNKCKHDHLKRRFRHNFYNYDLSMKITKKIKKDENFVLPYQNQVAERIMFVKYRKDSDGIQKHKDYIREKGTTHTGIIYLNDISNGETVFYLKDGRNIKVKPKEGRLCLFDIDIEHEGLPPLKEKYLLIFKIIKVKK